jgi:Predicted membrane protein
MNTTDNRKLKLSAEKFFIIVVLIFGVFSTFLTPPMTTGDEGYHLSYAYNQFSSTYPEAMSKPSLRAIETEAIGGETGSTAEISIKDTIFKKVDLENDGIRLNIVNNGNSFAPVNLMHLPASIGVLVARLIYPSIGVMDYGGRLANLLFFALCFYFIIKRSKQGKWLLVMLFTVPYLMKIASPSYDIFSFIIFSMFALNFLELTQISSFKELSRKQKIYSLATILLLFLAKKNYIFSLFALIGLPMFYKPLITCFKKITKLKKIIFSSLLLFLGIAVLFIFNEKLGLIHFTKVFFNNYLNFATMGTNARRMWMITPMNLPDFFNIIWVLLFCWVAMGEFRRIYPKWTAWSSGITYVVNWVGIFAGIYIGRKTMSAFDELSGRYLQPFIIFFLPALQNLGAKYNIELSEKTVANIAKISTITIMVLYLFIVFYRGFILKVKPTGVV